MSADKPNPRRVTRTVFLDDPGLILRLAEGTKVIITDEEGDTVAIVSIPTDVLRDAVISTYEERESTSDGPNPHLDALTKSLKDAGAEKFRFSDENAGSPMPKSVNNTIKSVAASALLIALTAISLWILSYEPDPWVAIPFGIAAVAPCAYGLRCIYMICRLERRKGDDDERR